MRRPRRGANFSVEFIFEGVQKQLGPEFEPVKAVSRYTSNGLWRRAYNVVEAAFRQGHVNHVTGDVTFLTYLLSKRKTLLTILDCGALAGEPTLRRRALKLLWYTLPVRRSEAVTVISHAVKEDLLRHVRVDPDKIHVVPVFVSSRYAASPRPFCAERPVILQIGTKPNKNVPRLIEALAGIPCLLRIVGALSDEHTALLRKHEVAYENFVGVSDERMLELYQSSDIIAFASTFEGFGMPIIEGNLVGRPVVTGNVTSMPEVAGGAACLVDPFDVSSIRAGIQRIISDESYREELVRRGFENAKRYDVATITQQYEGLYRRLSSPRG